MKLLKVVAMLGLSSLLAMNTAQAADKPQPKQKQTQKKDVALDRFNKNIRLQLISRGLQMDENNQTIVTFTYHIQNRGQNAIKSVNWIAGFQTQNQIIYAREIPLVFNTALSAGQQMDITFTIPLAELPQPAQQAFSDQNTEIGAVIGAKNLVFTNGKRIVVAK